MIRTHIPATEAVPLLLGASAPMWQLYENLRQAGRSDAKVLITGESGVGKEVAARLVHAYSVRRARPFSPVTCGGVADSLLESELFGRIRGGYTGADSDTSGLIERAQGGTLFLDEVGDMSARMQSALLRFLENGEVQKVGASRHTRPINVRIIAATTRVLLDGVAAHTFREDLYYRLNVIHLVVPPLRSRRQDIEPLLRYFLRQLSRRHHVALPEVPPDVLDSLRQYDWPGNVRELRHAVERFILRGGTRVTANDLIEGDAVVTPPARQAPPEREALAVADGPHPAVDAAGRELFNRLVSGRESFWSAVHKPFMTRDMTRTQVRQLIAAGLAETHGDYKRLVKLFNMPPTDYHRFLTFLHAHECIESLEDVGPGAMLDAVPPPERDAVAGAAAPIAEGDQEPQRPTPPGTEPIVLLRATGSSPIDTRPPVS